MKIHVENEPQRTPTRRAEPANLLVPAVDVIESKDAYVIEAEMPGVRRDGLEITLENHVLTLTGHRDPAPSKGEAIYVESKPASFRRSFEIDPTIDSTKITARLEQGLLTVTLPKADRVKPRKILVTD